MRRTRTLYRFASFEFDSATRQLRSGGDMICLTDTPSAMLALLLERAPDVVEKKAFATVGWGANATSDNNIEQAISGLRRALKEGDNRPFIETVRHRGYRFVAPLTRVDLPDVAASDPSLEPFHASLHGIREMTTLSLKGIAEARRSLELAVARVPTDAAAHAALGMACALMHEGTRVEPTRDPALLPAALHHARLAVTLDSMLADGWSTLGFALHVAGDPEAGAAGRKAVALEPDVWRHWLRLSYISWGDARIEAANRALALHPDLALAYWLKATVLIARGASAAALIPIRTGCAAQDTQRLGAGPYPAVGLHLLYALVLAAMGQLDEALRELARELEVPDHGQLYARERAANTWYARGAIHLRRGEHDAAEAALRRVLEIEPDHYFAIAALGLPIPTAPASGSRAVEAGIARSILLARQGRHPAAAEAFGKVLSVTAGSHAGWILPVEPVLHVSARLDLWSAALTIVRQRAT